MATITGYLQSMSDLNQKVLKVKNDRAEPQISEGEDDGGEGAAARKAAWKKKKEAEAKKKKEKEAQKPSP